MTFFCQTPSVLLWFLVPLESQNASAHCALPLPHEQMLNISVQYMQKWKVEDNKPWYKMYDILKNLLMAKILNEDLLYFKNVLKFVLFYVDVP